MPCASCTDSAGQVHHEHSVSRVIHGPKPYCPKCGQDNEMGVWDADHPTGVRWFCLRCRHVWPKAECARALPAEQVLLGDQIFHDGHWSHVAVSGPSDSRWALGILPAIVDVTQYVMFNRSDLVVIRRG